MTYIRGEGGDVRTHRAARSGDLRAHPSAHRRWPLGRGRRLLPPARHQPACHGNPRAPIHARVGLFSARIGRAPDRGVGGGFLRAQRRLARDFRGGGHDLIRIFAGPFERDLDLEKPAFWWESDAGRRVLAWRMPLGWYGTERDEIPQRLDDYRKFAPYWGVENIAVFYGLGNHGGGAQPPSTPRNSPLDRGQPRRGSHPLGSAPLFRGRPRRGNVRRSAGRARRTQLHVARLLRDGRPVQGHLPADGEPAHRRRKNRRGNRGGRHRHPAGKSGRGMGRGVVQHVPRHPAGHEHRACIRRPVRLARRGAP